MVPIGRLRQIEQLLQQAVHARRPEQIFPAHDMRDALQRVVDPMLHRERNLIERFFSKLQHFRRVATRNDKLAANFLAMVQLASLRL